MIVGRPIQSLISAVETAEHMALRGLNEGAIETEPSLTDRMLGAMDQTIGDGMREGKYRMTVRTLRDRGPNAPEREFGADLVSVFRVSVSEYEISKGFLAQAKLAKGREVTLRPGNGTYPQVFVQRPKGDAADPTSLFSQCRQMLAVSPSSYVFVYSNDGVFVLPASTIVSLQPNVRRKRVYMKPYRYFMTDFFHSFIGDIRLNAFDDDSLRRLREINISKHAMMVHLDEIEQQG